MIKIKSITAITAASLLMACTGGRDMKKAAETITSENLRQVTMTLGSDTFMGRKPFTEGEKITVNYLASELDKAGFMPLFGGSWYQEVPMTEISTSVTNPVVLRAGKQKLVLSAPDDIAVESPSTDSLVSFSDLPMVFCGFGIVAPEYGWDDYAAADVRGKCAVVMVNDPGLYTGDSTLFRGRAMTYYGRWTYKYEEAARHGASAVLIVHETTGAGYDYSIPRKSSITPSLFMERSENDPKPCDITGWLNGATADRFFSLLGYSTDSLRMEACRKGFRSFDLDAGLTVNAANSFISNRSVNVAGILPGSDKPDECIVITAHWDHFGIGEKENGDSIYNGAVDNGTSMAWALETGRAFASLRKRPSRSVILLFPTAEEQGLLGSYWFASHPPVKPEKIVACFNNDMLLPEGRMKDIMITGYGQSDLDDMIAAVAERQGRYIMPDPTPETGMYFRSDHFPFARIGVPSLFARGNCDSREYGREWAAAQEQDFLRNRYHKPADNYYPEMNFDGIAEDAQAIFEVAWTIAAKGVNPRWKEGSEFANIRK